MKKSLVVLMVAMVAVVMFSSCERVAPNKAGVLMENYGKAGKSDYSIQSGRVWTIAPGAELFQVPLWDQRGDFGDQVLHLKASDNTEFTSRPVFAYKVIKDRAVDVVFENSQIDFDENFLGAVSDNILEPRIYDLMKEESRKYTTEDLMAEGGSLKFELEVQQLVKKALNEKGFDLLSFSCQLDFSDKVKNKIDTRNEVNTNLTVLDQQIMEQKKRNELEELIAQQNIIKSKGLTPQILQLEWIEAWKETKQPLYGNTPFVKMIQ